VIPALKVWRLAKGLTVLQAAALFKVTYKTIYKWEAGTDPRTLKLLGRIEEVTGQKIQQLFPKYFKT